MWPEILWLIEWIMLITLALLTADFISGVIHWFADNYGNEDWPIIGPGLIAPFRNHHTNPRTIVDHSFWETNGSTIVLCFTLAPLAILLPDPLSKWWFLSCSIGSMTNQFHKVAHRKNNGFFWTLLMKTQLVISNKKHGHHHRPPRKQAYCITCGWLNPLLDRLSFFRRLEALIFKLTRVEPADG